LAFLHRQPDLTAGVSPRAVAAGDLDGDGNIDLAVANSDSDDVSIFWGNGDGTFVAAPETLPVQAPSQTLVIETPVAIAIADITGDGKLDIITANEGGNSISVLPNQGQRTFGAAIELPTGLSPEAVVVGDFNGDKILDVATPNLLDGTVTVLLGKGGGNFAILSVCSNHPELACRASSDCSGGGTCNPQPIPVGTSPATLVAADLNKDGKVDLIVANSEGGANFAGSLMVLQGVGNGVFVPQPEIESATFDNPLAIAAADLNRDGFPDVVVVNNDIGAPLSVLIGNGNLTFHDALALDLSADSIPAGVVVADLNGDGIPDIAACASLPDGVSAFVGLGNGTFAAPQNFATTPDSTPSGITTGDFNKDGKVDLATANDMQNGTVSVLVNASCVGDCGGDRIVTVDEILTMVNIALGNAAISECLAGDANGDHQITVDEILVAVSNALNGCPVTSP
jgi:hypothetical protein